MRHLTEEEVAICAEAIEKGQYFSLDSHIREHLSVCSDCAQEVLVVSEIADGFSFSAPKQSVFIRHKFLFSSVAALAAAALVLVLLNIGSDDLVVNQNQIAVNTQEDDVTTMENDSIDDKQITVEAVKHLGDSVLIEKPKQIAQENLAAGKKADIQKNDSDIVMPDSDEVEQNITGSSFGEVKEDEQLNDSTPENIPNAVLDALIDDLDLSAAKQKGLSLLVPNSISTNSSRVTLRWQNPQKHALVIDVLDNKAQIISSNTLDDDLFFLHNKKNGYYYWKLKTPDGELLYCGKVFFY